MKTIGLIGGMSWQSSKFYYQFLNELVAERLGGNHSAKVVISSVNFAEIERLFAQDDWNSVGELMAKEAKRLEDAGASLIILGTNTVHQVAQYIKEAISIPFLHIAQVTGLAIQAKGFKKVGLLGTKFTMEKEFYSKILIEDFGLEVIIPEEEERIYLQDIIFRELVKGTFTGEAQKSCLDIIKNLKGKGAEGVILGCTELPILIPYESSPIPTFDTTMIHSKAAVDLALQ